MASKNAKLKRERNRAWGYPLIAASIALTFYVARGADAGGMRLLTEITVAATAGFFVAAASIIRLEKRAGKPKKKSKAKRAVQADLNEGEINVLRSELTQLRASLKDYIAAKRAEGVKIHGTIIDLNNDVASLKESDPAEKLRPQLRVIAEKFGELSDVRRIVKTLSGKMRRVETLAGQIAEVEARIQKQAKVGANANDTAAKGWVNWMSKVRSEVSGMWKQVSTELRTDVIRETEDHVDKQISAVVEAQLSKRRGLRPSERAGIINEVRSEISGRVNARVEKIFETADVAKVVSGIHGAQDERMKAMQGRMASMAAEMARLQQQLSDLQSNKANEERGISIVLEEEGFLPERKPRLSERVGKLIQFGRKSARREAA